MEDINSEPMIAKESETAINNLVNNIRRSNKKAQERELSGAILQLMKTQNELLVDQKRELIDRVRRIESNLDFVAGKAESLEYEVVSGRTTILRSLARIEGLPDNDQLLNEADKIRQSQAEVKGESYRNAGAGKLSNRG